MSEDERELLMLDFDVRQLEQVIDRMIDVIKDIAEVIRDFIKEIQALIEREKFDLILNMGCKPNTKVATNRIYYRCRNNC